VGHRQTYDAFRDPFAEQTHLPRGARVILPLTDRARSASGWCPNRVPRAFVLRVGVRGTARPGGLGSARRACPGVEDLHALDEEPQCQPDFSHEAHGEPGVVDRGVVRQ
jgi:hypothetical protein